MAAITDRVIEIICTQLGVKKESVSFESSFVNDLQADSLDTVELMMELEEEFGVSIPDEEAQQITTVGKAIKYIEEHSS
ncbi:MAG: acyl carrier protein [Planctomycetota bacterium]|nr:MAG: acyl carrier protein [Planctomycetota bacterium]